MGGGAQTRTGTLCGSLRSDPSAFVLEGRGSLSLRKLCDSPRQDEGVISEARHRDLTETFYPLNPDKEAAVILHESGVPPLHTPAAILAGMARHDVSRSTFTHLECGHRPAQGPSAPQIRPQRLCIRGVAHYL